MALKVLSSTSPVEWPGIVTLGLLTLLKDLGFVGNVVPRELWLKLRGAWFLVGIAQSELGGFVESCVLRKYEPGPSFRPEPGSTIADIGANVGFFTVMHALRNVRVLAVEPNPEAYRRLEAAVVRNHLEHQVTLFNCALAQARGEAELVLDDRSTTTGRLNASPVVLGRRTVTVKTKTLDDVAENAAVEVVRLVKMDVEGAECDVLKGGRRTLSITSRLVLEYHGASALSCVRNEVTQQGFEEVFVDRTHVAFLRSSA